MIREILAWGREIGCEEAWLGAEPDNVAANGLYRSLGSAPTTALPYEFDLAKQASSSGGA